MKNLFITIITSLSLTACTAENSGAYPRIIELVIIIVLAVFLILVITDRIRTQARLRSEEEARRLKHEMTGNISHELKTPVSSIMGYLETLVNNPDLPEDKRRLFIERSYLQSIRLSEMISDISLITKMEEVPEQFKLDSVNIRDSFEEVLEELAEKINAQEITVEDSLPPVCIMANYNLLYAIFRNLVENSVKYAGKGCRIKMSVRLGSDEDVFDYSDNGKGVPEEEYPRIFGRFYRLSEDRGSSSSGSGLGLSIVRNAVIFHKGSISAYRPEGGGLGFRFTIKR